MESRVHRIIKRAAACCIILILALSGQQIRAQVEVMDLYSPDSTIHLEIQVDDRISYAAYHGDEKILDQSSLSLDVKGSKPYSRDPQLSDINRKKISEIIKPVVPLKHEALDVEYNELTLSFARPYRVKFRAYKEGIAYRLVLDSPDSLHVLDEEVEYDFSGDFRILYPQERSMISHYERLYKDTTLSGLDNQSFCSLPTTLQTSEGTTLVISDADLFDYPNLFLSPENSTTLTGKFPNRVLETQSTSDRNEKITKKADDIARVAGKQKLPWRAMKISDNSADLLVNDLFYALARDVKLEETDWINPGKVAWDWWNALNIYDVPFESGVNNKTYKHYIDFAAEQSLDYVILDEGWSNTTDLMDVKTSIDIPELVSYAEERNVGLILWMLWKPLQQNLHENLAQFEEWGIKGLKIDFMQRADQDMVQFYERVAREAAEHHLLVNFHGSYKPAGLRRAYPNVLTYEGVKGLENSKWSDVITPSHDVTLPFTRMSAGPMDFTPGAMINAHKDNFRAIFTRPMSQGTRAHQVAMYAIYESGMQMLADSPSHYKEEPATTDYISRFPVTWHETLALEAELAEYLVMARRHDKTWYLGAMTGSSTKTDNVELTFLESDVTYKATIYEDGVNADRYAEDFRMREKTVEKGDTLQYEMVKGGGWAAILEPVADK